MANPKVEYVEFDFEDRKHAGYYIDRQVIMAGHDEADPPVYAADIEYMASATARALGVELVRHEPDASEMECWDMAWDNLPAALFPLDEYYVVWDIEVDASSYEEAARAAREAQLRPDTIATNFQVMRKGKDTNPILVDCEGLE